MSVIINENVKKVSINQSVKPILITDYENQTSISVNQPVDKLITVFYPGPIGPEGTGGGSNTGSIASGTLFWNTYTTTSLTANVLISGSNRSLNFGEVSGSFKNFGVYSSSSLFQSTLITTSLIPTDGVKYISSIKLEPQNFILRKEVVNSTFISLPVVAETIYQTEGEGNLTSDNATITNQVYNSFYGFFGTRMTISQFGVKIDEHPSNSIAPNGYFLNWRTDSNLLNISSSNTQINTANLDIFCTQGPSTKYFRLLYDQSTGTSLSSSRLTFLTSASNFDLGYDNSTPVLFTDNRNTKRGIEYSASYSASYSTRSLADWGSILGSKIYTDVQSGSFKGSFTGSIATASYALTGDSLDIVTPSISSNTASLDFSGLKQRMFTTGTSGSSYVTSSFTLNVISASNALVFNWCIFINGNVLVTCPNNFAFQSSETRWNSSTKVLTLNYTNKKIENSGVYDGVNWAVKSSIDYT